MMVEALRGELRRVWARGAGQDSAAGRCLRGALSLGSSPAAWGSARREKGSGASGRGSVRPCGLTRWICLKIARASLFWCL